ncbi:MAG: hypothetical protein JNL09_00925 [Anaerolineales bacterium]|nr:hypothetical protein [Anaerolineales bacterium]
MPALFPTLLLIIIALLAVRLWQRSPGRNPNTYSVELAWLRAGIYFASCWLVSWSVGALQHITSQPLATAAQLQDVRWWALAALCLLIEIVGYYVIWPRGTLTHGRALHWPTVFLFGLLWGLSEGQLFVSVWALAQSFTSNTLIVAIVTFVVLSAFIGMWHALYWDIYVAPEHNIAEWNGRKVLFAHIPNLVVTLTFLALHGNWALMVLFQTVALLGSTYFMRFPRYVADAHLRA